MTNVTFDNCIAPIISRTSKNPKCTFNTTVQKKAILLKSSNITTHKFNDIKHKVTHNLLETRLAFLNLLARLSLFLKLFTAT